MRTASAVSTSARLREYAACGRIMARFWRVVFPLVRAELRAWEARAQEIPDRELREQALGTLRSERLSVAGAALFAATLDRHEPALVRALVAFQVTIDYLDTLSEQPTADPIGNGAQLHRALAAAVAPGARQPDYYARHHVRDDGGYLAALIGACRGGCGELPAYEQVRGAAALEAGRTAVQGINHAPARLRDPALRRWAAEQVGDADDASWFELAAAGASSLAVLALLAAAAEPATTAAAAERVRAATSPGSRRSARCSTASSTASATRSAARRASSATTPPTRPRWSGWSRSRRARSRARGGCRTASGTSC